MESTTSSQQQSALGLPFPQTAAQRLSRAQWVDKWSARTYAVLKELNSALAMWPDSKPQLMERREAEAEWELGRVLVESLGPVDEARFSHKALRVDLFGALVSLMELMSDKEWASQEWLRKTLGRWLVELKPWESTTSNGFLMNGLSSERADRFAELLEEAHGSFSFAGELTLARQPSARDPKSAEAKAPLALSERSALLLLGHRLTPHSIAAIRRHEPEMFEGENLAKFLSNELVHGRLALIEAALGSNPAPKKGVWAVPAPARRAAWDADGQEKEEGREGGEKQRVPAEQSQEQKAQAKKDAKKKAKAKASLGLWDALASRVLRAPTEINRADAIELISRRLAASDELAKAIEQDADLAEKIGDCALVAMLQSRERTVETGLSVFERLPESAKGRPAGWAWALAKAHWGGNEMPKAKNGKAPPAPSEGSWDAAAKSMAAIRWEGQAPRGMRGELTAAIDAHRAWSAGEPFVRLLREIGKVAPKEKTLAEIDAVWEPLANWRLDSVQEAKALGLVVEELLAQGVSVEGGAAPWIARNLRVVAESRPQHIAHECAAVAAQIERAQLRQTVESARPAAADGESEQSLARPATRRV